jgi:hypothetical protein
LIPFTERENLGANIGTSAIQMLLMSCVFPEQINKHKKQSSRTCRKILYATNAFVARGWLN